MKTLQLTFNNKTISTTSVEHEGQDFFNLNEIFHASTEVKSSKRPSQWRNKLSKRYQEEGSLQNLVECKNASKTNYDNLSFFGTQEVVIAYSQWLQADFAYIVNQAFSLLIDGKVNEALSVAQQVAAIERARTKETNKSLKTAVSTACDLGQLTGREHHRQIHFANLAFQFATGQTATKMKNLLGKKAPRDYLVEQGDYEAVRRLEEAQVTIKTLLSVGFDFQQIKAHLNIK